MSIATDDIDTADRGEAAFVAVQDLPELDRYAAVRRALSKTLIDSSGDELRPGVAFAEWRAKHRARLSQYANTPPPALEARKI